MKETESTKIIKSLMSPHHIVIYNAITMLPILIFHSIGSAAIYLFRHKYFDKRTSPARTLITSLIRNKKINDTNIFNIPIIIKTANKEQENLLGKERVMVLDETYRLQKIIDEINTDEYYLGNRIKPKPEKLSPIPINSTVEVISGKYIGAIAKITNIKNNEYFLQRIDGKEFRECEWDDFVIETIGKKEKRINYRLSRNSLKQIEWT